MQLQGLQLVKPIHPDHEDILSIGRNIERISLARLDADCIPRACGKGEAPMGFLVEREVRGPDGVKSQSQRFIPNGNVACLLYGQKPAESAK